MCSDRMPTATMRAGQTAASMPRGRRCAAATAVPVVPILRSNATCIDDTVGPPRLTRADGNERHLSVWWSSINRILSCEMVFGRCHQILSPKTPLRSNKWHANILFDRPRCSFVTADKQTDCGCSNHNSGLAGMYTILVHIAADFDRRLLSYSAVR